MTDTADFVTNVNVRDLIAVYEHKSEQPVLKLQRPRAKSVGNILHKHVIVRSNEFRTLEDVESALNKLETDLNYYEVYYKEKHVSLQERLFNLLTCVVNIEGEVQDDPVKKKRLITKTQNLVAFLNQKLPSNSAPSSDNQFKYTTYSSFLENQNKDKELTDEVRPPENVYQTYNENEIVSVRKLKQNFQTAAPETLVSLHKTSDVGPLLGSNVKATSEISAGIESSPPTAISVREERTDHKPFASVSRLRGLFEKSTDTSSGLEIIVKNSNKPLFESNIPYIEGNLASHRFQRAATGNYMDYARMVRSVDVPRSKSAFDLNNNMQFDQLDTVGRNEESDSRSDISCEEDIETSSSESIASVKEVELEHASSLDDLPGNIVKNTVNRYENIILATSSDEHSTDLTKTEIKDASIVIPLQTENPSMINNIIKSENTSEESIRRTESIGETDEIPANIVQRTRKAYEHPAISVAQDDTYPHFVDEREITYSSAEIENYVPENLVLGVNNVETSQITEVDALNVAHIENDEEQDIEYPNVIIEPEEIPINIVQRTVQAYEQAVTSEEVTIPHSNENKNEVEYPTTPEANNVSENTIFVVETDTTFLTSQVTEADGSEVVEREHEEQNIEYTNAIIEPANTVSENTIFVVETDKTFLTSQVTEADGSEVVEIEHEDMQEQEIEYSSATIESANTVSENTIFSVETDTTFLTSQVIEADGSEVVEMEHEDMQEQEIEYSSATIESDEIPNNIVERTVQAFEHATTAQEDISSHANGKENEVECSTAETVLLGQAEDDVVDGNILSSDTTHVRTDEFVEEDVPFSIPVIDSDGVARPNIQHPAEKRKLLLTGNATRRTSETIDADDDDAGEFGTPRASICESDLEDDPISILGYTNGDIIDVSLDEEDLEKADEEFEKLMQS